MTLEFKRLEIPDLILVRGWSAFEDRRGFFVETYKRTEFADNGISATFLQDSYSESVRGVVRGLHYQNPPKAQGKLVSVLRGEIYDAAVDIRRGSQTYGQWVGLELSANRHEMLWIPPGFAHGFCVLSDVAGVMYKMTNEYDANSYRGIVWNDPDIGIRWPVEDPIVSERDAELPRLADADNSFVYEPL